MSLLLLLLLLPVILLYGTYYLYDKTDFVKYIHHI